MKASEVNQNWNSVNIQNFRILIRKAQKGPERFRKAQKGCERSRNDQKYFKKFFPFEKFLK